ncbi:MAG: dethiobiotin synthase [Legionellales bacterium]|nr:dethiobiotin synthase [Legionellales bacterium]
MQTVARRLFITGTDTDVGKTYATVELLTYFAQQGLTTVAIKPVATGGVCLSDGWRNDDAVQLQHHATRCLPYEEVNPIVFEPPIAPHIAAQLVQQSLTASQIVEACLPALNQSVDVAVMEGAGGWLLPLTDQTTMADVVGELQAAVILVVGMRLGCLNHALLTEQAILHDERIKLLGWIANCVSQTMPYRQQNIQTLQSMMRSSCLGVIPYQQPAQFDQQLVTRVTDLHHRHFASV